MGGCRRYIHQDIETLALEPGAGEANASQVPCDEAAGSSRRRGSGEVFRYLDFVIFLCLEFSIQNEFVKS